MSRKAWGPVRRHFVRNMFYYLIVLLIIVFVVGIVLSILMGAKFFRHDAKARFERPSYIPSDYQNSANLILPFCGVRGVNLILCLPSSSRNIVGIAYHEARNPKAFSLEPIGHQLKNDNVYKTDVPLDSKASLPIYYIMESRGEPQSATSAADIAMSEGVSVLSPVSGVVTKVEPKKLYENYDDTQIEITPPDCQELRVVVIHIKEVKVTPGMAVKQGRTVLGIPRDYRENFQSEIDDYIKPAHPHVHIQVNRYVPEQN